MELDEGVVIERERERERDVGIRERKYLQLVYYSNRTVTGQPLILNHLTR